MIGVVLMIEKSGHHGRLHWKCRRGMLELDLVLLSFLEKNYENLSEHEQHVFERLLDEEDPVLQSWFMRQVIPEDKELAAMVEYIRHSVGVKGV